MANLITVGRSVWAEDVFMRCPGATQNGFEQALYNALREFCKESGAWIVEMWDYDSDNDIPQPFNDGEDTPFYDLQAKLVAIRNTSGTSYVSGDPAVSHAQFHTLPDYWPWDILYLHKLSYFDDYTWDPNPSQATQRAARFIWPGQTPNSRAPHATFASVEGWPTRFLTYNERPGALQLVPTMPERPAGFIPWVSLGFPRAAIDMGIPVVFERVWYEVILDGTVNKLVSQQDKPYTNPTLAQYHGTRFRNGISVARDMAERQMSDSERGWNYPAWA